MSVRPSLQSVDKRRNLTFSFNKIAFYDFPIDALRRQRATEGSPTVNRPCTYSNQIQRPEKKEQRHPLLPNLGTRLVVLNPDGVTSRSCLTLSVVDEEQESHGAEVKSSIRRVARKSLSIRPRSTVSSPLGQHLKKCARRSDRTSRMLVAVLCLFLITEFPQGIMAFLSGLYGQEFFRQCYNSFAEIWDILALTNSAVNFLLYCFMSKQFRVQFRKFLSFNRCFNSTKILNGSNVNCKNTMNTVV